MTDTDLERRLRDMRLADLPSGSAGRPIDTARAWRDFQALRSRSVAIRHRTMTAAALVVVAATAIAFPALAGSRSGNRPPHPGASSSLPASTRSYPGAVAARFQLSGVTAVIGDAGHAWVLRAIGQPGAATTYQLAGINLQTNSIMFRTNLGRQQPAIASGAGRVWLTTPFGQARGQIVRVDLATGHVLSTVHLAAGRCDALSFGSGHLFAHCEVNGPARTAFWRINPVTQRAYQLTGALRGSISSVVATPQALWYVVNDTRISGLQNIDGNPQRVTARDPGYQVVSPGAQGLVYDETLRGSIWALSGGEELAQIDSYTGHVVRYFTYRNYDPARAGGLDFLTTGGGWLWFLDNGYPFSGALRVSEATGRPAGGVAVLLLIRGDRGVEFLTLFHVVAAGERKDDPDLHGAFLGERRAGGGHGCKCEQGERTTKKPNDHAEPPANASLGHFTPETTRTLSNDAA